MSGYKKPRTCKKTAVTNRSPNQSYSRITLLLNKQCVRKRGTRQTKSRQKPSCRDKTPEDLTVKVWPWESDWDTVRLCQAGAQDSSRGVSSRSIDAGAPHSTFTLLYTNNAVSARTNVTTRRWRSPRRVAPPLITVTTVTVAAITTGWETSQGERELGNKVR